MPNNTLTTETYYEAARTGDLETIQQYLTENHSKHTEKPTIKQHTRSPRTSPHKYPFSPYLPVSPTQNPLEVKVHQHALETAITHAQVAVVSHLLNVKISPSQKLINEETKRNTIIFAISHQQFDIASLLIHHCNEIRSPFYTKLRNQLSAVLTQSTSHQPCSTAAQNVILHLLQHPKLEQSPRRFYETFIDIGIIHGAIDIIHYLLNDRLHIETYNDYSKSLLLFALAKSTHSERLLQTFPILHHLLEKGINYIGEENRATLLIAAAKANNVSLMQRILVLDPDQLNKLDYNEHNALIVAALSETPAKEAMLWLIGKGMSTEQTDHETARSLLKTLAANPAQIEMFEVLLTQYAGDITTITSPSLNEESLIDCILQGLVNLENHPSPVTLRQALRPFYAICGKILRDCDSQPNAMNLAARFNDIDAIQTNASSLPLQSRLTPLTQVGHCLFSRHYLGATMHSYRRINECNKVGETPLHELALNSPDIILSILENYSLSGITTSNPIFRTLQGRLFRLIDAIKQLHSAINIIACIDMFLDRGIFINVKEKNGDTPFHLAAQCHNEPVVTHLYRRGANINQTNNEGQTPLMLACKDNNVDVITTLIQQGADMAIRDKQGNNMYSYLRGNDIEIQAEVYGFIEERNRVGVINRV